VDDPCFERAVQTAKVRDLEWGSAPRVVDRQIDSTGGGRRVYIRDPDGIAYEFFTNGAA
jgi:catechol 2,3-dioxygenase-like lactoylglutathione lyase family enzyme